MPKISKVNSAAVSAASRDVSLTVKSTVKKPKKPTAPAPATAPTLKKAPLKTIKTIRPKKKVKSVLVDVIEDEPIGEAVWPEYENTSPTTEKPEATELMSGSKPDDQLDSQKKFFSDLVSEMKDKKNPSFGGKTSQGMNNGENGEKINDKINSEASDDQETSDRSRRRVGLYRRFAIKFVIIVVILAAIVGYFSFSKLTVEVTLKGETAGDNLLFSITDPALAATSTVADLSLIDPRQPIDGVIESIGAGAEKTFLASGEEFVGEEIAGQVRIINNYNKNQSLVATTRLLSPDNKLFRIKEAVNVPAGGEVVAEIYVEKPAADLAINPTTFTIPGLWVGLQDKIYAQSDTAFVFKQKIKKYVKPSDLERAASEINELLVADAEAKAGAISEGDNEWLFYTGGPRTIVIDAKVNEEKDEFTAQATSEIFAVSFSKETAAELAAAKLRLLIPDDKELTEFDPEEISYSLEAYDPLTGTATVKADFAGTIILKTDSEIIDRRQLINLTAEQLATYLKSQPEIKSYELKFFPTFIKRAPGLVDRIEVKIKN